MGGNVAWQCLVAVRRLFLKLGRGRMDVCFVEELGYDVGKSLYAYKREVSRGC